MHQNTLHLESIIQLRHSTQASPVEEQSIYAEAADQCVGGVPKHEHFEKAIALTIFDLLAKLAEVIDDCGRLLHAVASYTQD